MLILIMRHKMSWFANYGLLTWQFHISTTTIPPENDNRVAVRTIRSNLAKSDGTL